VRGQFLQINEGQSLIILDFLSQEQEETLEVREEIEYYAKKLKAFCEGRESENRLSVE